MATDEADLYKLNAAVSSLLEQESFLATVERLRGQLLGSDETFVWSTVELHMIPCELPDAIKSCWIFHLRRGVPSGFHYHPNSVQHMVVISGSGTSDVGGRRGVMVPFMSSERSLQDRWYVIPQGEPHQFTPEGEDMTVVSFHTCEAHELKEIACETGGTRTYERPDA